MTLRSWKNTHAMQKDPCKSENKKCCGQKQSQITQHVGGLEAYQIRVTESQRGKSWVTCGWMADGPARPGGACSHLSQEGTRHLVLLGAACRRCQKHLEEGLSVSWWEKITLQGTSGSL